MTRSLGLHEDAPRETQLISGIENKDNFVYERDTGTVEHTAADAIASTVNSEEENFMTGLFLSWGPSWLRSRTKLCGLM